MTAGEEILDLLLDAIEEEIREREFYLALAKRVKNPLVRRKINGIADDEMEHRQTLNRLYWSQSGKEPLRVEPDPSSIAIPDMDGRSLKDLFKTAMVMEEVSAGKFNRMAFYTLDERTADFLEYLADFEREHYETLSAELRKIQSHPGWEDQGPAD